MSEAKGESAVCAIGLASVKQVFDGDVRHAVVVKATTMAIALTSCNMLQICQLSIIYMDVAGH